MKKFIILAFIPFLTACPMRKGPGPAPASVATPDVEKVDENVSEAIAILERQALPNLTVEERILFAQKIADQVLELTKNENTAPSPATRP